MKAPDELQREALRICMDLFELPLTERLRELDARTVHSPPLRALVMQLLDAAEEGDTRLPAAGGWALPPRDLAGGEIGGYRLIRLLGSGGMGSVYLAERRVGDACQQVALKLITPVAARAADIIRFGHEQQALARLHHPYIAAFIDAGVTAEGMPYLAMEYVPGTAITDWCAAHAAAIGTRLELWLKLCEAVACAHRNLIVHRDIKPANVLVSAEGLPKLLDFGVAKLLDSHSTGETTRFAQQLTLDYATPERILRSTVSTQDDVYALAVLLFELLAGARPFRRGELTLENLLGTVGGEHAPDLASAFLQAGPVRQVTIARERQLGVRALQSLLGGDLAAICARALHPDAERRYASVDALAADVRAFQRGEPVAAVGDSAFYRLARWVRRNKARAAVTTVCLTALVAVLGVYLVQTAAVRRQAERTVVVNRFLEELLAAPNARWDTAWRGHADLRMSELLALASTKLESELAGEPEVRARLHGSLARSFSALSMPDRAVEEQRKALRIVMDELPESLPLRPRVLTTMATMLDYVATPEAIAEARVHLDAALRWFRQHQPGPGFDHAATLGELGYSHFVAGDYDRAIAIFLDTEAMHLAAGGDPEHPIRALGVGLIGLACFDDRQWALSQFHLDRSIDLYRKEGNQGLADAVWVYGARIVHHVVAGTHNDALPLVQTLLPLAETTAGQASREHFLALGVAAWARCEAGDSRSCDRYLLEADRILAVIGANSPLYRANLDLIRAEQLLREGRREEALSRLVPHARLGAVATVRSNAGFNAAGRWHLAMADALRGSGDGREADAHRTKGLQLTAAIVGAQSPFMERLRRRPADSP